MSSSKTWDEFIARQVQAQLSGEFVLNSMWAEMHPSMYSNRGIQAPKSGLVWCYGFGRLPPGYEWAVGHWNYVRERWFVNLRTEKVLDVKKD